VVLKKERSSIERLRELGAGREVVRERKARRVKRVMRKCILRVAFVAMRLDLRLLIGAFSVLRLFEEWSQGFRSSVRG